MSAHSPFPWTVKPTVYGTMKLVDGTGLEFGALFNKIVDGNRVMAQNAATIAAVPGLLKAAMIGHGWGDPLHQRQWPACEECKAIRQAIGPLTRERVLDLARLTASYIKALIDDGHWGEVYMHLGIGDNDPHVADALKAGEFEAIDVDILHAVTPR